MTDSLVQRLREAIDDEQLYAETADHLSRQDSVSLLRRCAADRKILELHKVQIQPHVPGMGTGYACLTCDNDTYEGAIYGPEFGCPTLKALAEAYGVEV